MILNSLHAYYNGLGTSEYSNSLPIQTLPDSKKTRGWRIKNMDRLEQIAISQLSRNIEFRDYYKMVEGRLTYSDFEAPPEIEKIHYGTTGLYQPDCLLYRAGHYAVF